MFYSQIVNGAGRAIGVVSRQQDETGLIDVGLDDFPESSPYHAWQQTVLDTVGILVVGLIPSCQVKDLFGEFTETIGVKSSPLFKTVLHVEM